MKDPAEETFAARILLLLSTLGGTSQIDRPHRGTPKNIESLGLSAPSLNVRFMRTAPVFSRHRLPHPSGEAVAGMKVYSSAFEEAVRPTERIRPCSK